MVRLFNHWFASNTLMQIAFDALLLFLSVVLAVAFLNRGDVTSLFAIVPDALLFACDPPGTHVEDDTDCDDTAATVNPGAAEICGDGVDQDCDGTHSGCSLGGTISASAADEAVYGGDVQGWGGSTVRWLGDQDGDGTYTQEQPPSSESWLQGQPGGGYARLLRAGGQESYDASGRLQSEVDAAGVATTYGYDESGRLSSVSRRGRALVLSYEGTSSRPARVQGPGGQVLALYTYEASSGRLSAGRAVAVVAGAAAVVPTIRRPSFAAGSAPKASRRSRRSCRRAGRS